MKHLHRTTTSPTWNLHALVIDLTVPGVHFTATATTQRKRTTSSFAKLISAQGAINGDFFSYTDYSTSGLAAGSGAPWTDTKDTASSGNLAFDKTTRVELHKPSEVLAFDKTWMFGVVSGHPSILAAGVVPADSGSLCTGRNPRTAVGMSKDGKTLYLAVVDGRSSASVGMTCSELGKLMKGLGAEDALNFDGGGSSTMYIAGLGVVNVPSDGAERTVGNHLALFAPKSGTVGTIKGTVYVAPTPTAKLAGATVSVAGQGSDVTDAAGAYEILVPPGSYTIKAQKSGYVTGSVQATACPTTRTTARRWRTPINWTPTRTGSATPATLTTTMTASSTRTTTVRWSTTPTRRTRTAMASAMSARGATAASMPPPPTRRRGRRPGTEAAAGHAGPSDQVDGLARLALLLGLGLFRLRRRAGRR